MMPDEYYFNKSGDTLQEMLGVDLSGDLLDEQDVKRRFTEAFNDQKKELIAMATLSFIISMNQHVVSSIALVLNAVGGYDLKKPIDLIDYLLKTLSYEEYIRLIDSLVKISENMEG